MVCFSDNVQPGPSMHKLLTIVIMICISSIDVVIIPNVIGNGSYLLGAAVSVAVDNVYIVQFFPLFWSAAAVAVVAVFRQMLAVGDVRPHFTPPYPQTFGTTPQQTTPRVLLLLNSTLLTFGHTSTPAYYTNPPKYQANLKHIMIPAATVPLKNLDGAFSMPNKATKIPLVSETPWCV